MPLVSSAQYGMAQAAAHGGANRSSMSPSVAREMIAKTPPDKRSQFARQRYKTAKERKRERSERP